MTATVEVRVVPMGDPEPGVWCGYCQLPSAVRQMFEIILGDSVWGRLWTIRACEECGTTVEDL